MMDEIKPQVKVNYVDNKALLASIVQWQIDIRRAKRNKLPTPPIPDFVGECMMKIANRLSQKAGFVNYCYAEDVQMLTKRGWLGWDQVTTDDIALSCDPADNRLKWGPIHEIYINKNYDGMMFHLTGNGLDALVTPGHKFLTMERGLVKVEYLKQTDHITLMGLPTEAPEIKKYSDAFVKLIGWAVTEGHYAYGKRKHSVSIAQSKTCGITDIIESLNGSGAHWTKHIRIKDKWRDYSYETDDGRILTARYNSKGKHSFHVTGDVANEIITVAPNRVLSSEFVLSLTHDQRLLLIDTMISGDGHRTKRPSGTIGRFYNQKDKKHLDAFVSLCAQSGIRTTEKLNTIESAFGKSSIWRVNLCEGGNSKWGTKIIGCKIENIDFHGAKRDLTNADHCKGELHKNSKLTDEIVLEAKRLHANGWTYPELATKFSVHKTTLWEAATGRKWKHLTFDAPKEHQHVASIPYTGIVWCPSTNYGTIVCRRNGKVFVSSNSYRDEMVADSLESCCRYLHNFDPRKSNNPFAYITQIIHNAFIRRIQKEQKQLYVKMKIIDQSDFVDSYERQDGDGTSYNNSYVTYLQENKGDVIAKFENWKEGKKNRANAKKSEANLNALFEEEQKKDGKPVKKPCAIPDPPMKKVRSMSKKDLRKNAKR